MMKRHAIQLGRAPDRLGRRRVLGILAAAILAAAAGAGVLSEQSSQAAVATRVLFIGNSYTYVNNLPELVSKLAASRHLNVETEMVAPGGWRLQDHWEKGDAPKVLHRGH
jgi:hypothetical protein